MNETNRETEATLAADAARQAFRAWQSTTYSHGADVAISAARHAVLAAERHLGFVLDRQGAHKAFEGPRERL